MSHEDSEDRASRALYETVAVLQLLDESLKQREANDLTNEEVERIRGAVSVARRRLDFVLEHANLVET